MILVVGMNIDLSSSDVSTDDSPRFMKFGLSVMTASHVRFIRQSKKTSVLDLPRNLRPITLLHVGTGSLGLAGIPLMEVLNG